MITYILTEPFISNLQSKILHKTIKSLKKMVTMVTKYANAKR